MSDAVLGQFEQMTVKSEGTYPRKARVGIIGAGWIAESHVESYLRMPDVEIVAVADLIDGKAKAFCERFGIKGANLYNSHKELLASEKLDAVSVCTYNRTHAECAIDALKAGVNVLLEKPMCVTLEEGIEIMRAEKESGKVLSIGFQPRFDKNMQKVKEIVDSGMLGEIYYIQTGGGRRRGIPNSTFIEQKTAGIGAIGDIGCYALDLVLNAIGYPKPLTASGYTSAFFGTNTDYSKPENACRFNVDDFAAAFVRLDGGIILDFRIAWAMHIDSPCDTIILGKKCGLRIPATECWNGTMSAPMTFYTDMAGSFTETKIPLIPNSEGKGLFYQKIRSFLDAVMYGGKAPIPTSQAIYNQAIIDGIVRSAKLGREVEINVPEV